MARECTTKDALAQTVKRLRTDLETMPTLQIVSGKNKGYCLNFQEEPQRTA